MSVISLEAHRLTVPLVRIIEPVFFSPVVLSAIKIISDGLIEADWLMVLGVCSSWAA